MSTYNFIETYNIPDDICNNFIKYYKKNKEYKAQGSVAGNVVNKNIKDSTEVHFYNQSQEKFILKFFNLLSNAVNSYINKYKIISNLHTEIVHNIQHYKKKAGYFKEHYEKENLNTIDRELVYMLYCNDVKNGGTYFPFQDKKIECIKGNLILWPAHFTHPHHGIISDEEEKYIVTGWFLVK